MQRAYVAINVEINTDDDVKGRIKQIPSVKNVYSVFGIYDLFVELDGSSEMELKDAVYKIRQLPNIRNILTLMTVNGR